MDGHAQTRRMKQHLRRRDCVYEGPRSKNTTRHGEAECWGLIPVFLTELNMRMMLVAE